jgi:hypothetical protein
MDVIPLEMVTEFSELQYWNTLYPKDATLPGMVTEVRAVQPENA